MSNERFTASLFAIGCLFLWVVGLKNPAIHFIESLIFTLIIGFFPLWITSPDADHRCPGCGEDIVKKNTSEG